MTLHPRPASPDEPTNVETDHPHAPVLLEARGAHTHAVQLSVLQAAAYRSTTQAPQSFPHASDGAG